MIRATGLLVCLLATGATIMPGDAQAYVDPGTGAMLVQWLFGLAMAAIAALTVYWQRLKALFTRHNTPSQLDSGSGKSSGSEDRG